MSDDFEDSMPADDSNAIDEPDSPGPTAWRRRTPRVLGIAAVVVAIGAVATIVAPFVLPTYIVEGPLIQQLGPDSASIVWYASRDDDDGMTVEVAGARYPAERDGTRCVARIEGLAPGKVDRFTIMSGDREISRGTVRGARLPGAEFGFLVFGDSGKGSRAQYNLAIRMEQEAADFIVHTGDLIYSGGERRRYRARFFEPYGPLLRQIPFWPSLGNHDVSEPDFGQPYLDVFELPTNGPVDEPPEHHYWFDYANARFVVLDTNRELSDLAEHVAPWIREVFADGPLWRFAVFHHPPYTSGKHTPDLKVQQVIVRALEDAGVQMAFSGHDHLYVRTHPLLRGHVVSPREGGIHYVVSGAGGALLYDALPPELRPEYVAVADSRQHSFTSVRVARNKLRLVQIGLDGSTLDEFELTIPRTRPSPSDE